MAVDVETSEKSPKLAVDAIVRWLKTVRPEGESYELDMEELYKLSLKIYKMMVDMDKGRTGHHIGSRHVFTALAMGLVMGQAGCTIKDEKPDVDVETDEWGMPELREVPRS